MSIKKTYHPYLINNTLSISQSKGDFPLINIDNEFATASISIYGAQVLSYKLKSANLENINTEDKDLLFVSESAYFEQGKAIKGGIPICWPWFGKDADNPDRQMHGFVRNMLWELEETSQQVNGGNQVILSLSDSEDTHKLWPHSFKLILTIEVGRTLKLSLKTINVDQKQFKITQALHTYFSISDISQVQLKGLDETLYLDKVINADLPIAQKGDITVTEEVDRIYIDAPSELVLHDAGSNNQIKICSKGSQTTVVWNPWINISENSADLTDDAYLHFICVETANAADDVIALGPNESTTIEAEYIVSSHLH